MSRLIETRLPDGRITYVADEPTTCHDGHPITERVPWHPCPGCEPRRCMAAQWRCGEGCVVVDPLHEHGRSGAAKDVVVYLDGRVEETRRG